MVGPVIAPLPLALRTLVLTAIVVPVVVYAVVPGLLRVRTHFYRRMTPRVRHVRRGA